MTKKRVETLSGIDLDWAVAQIEHPGKKMGSLFGSDLLIPDLDDPECYYSPSSTWSIAGPIIEREEMNVTYEGKACWIAGRYNGVVYAMSISGSTPLEAAMRCHAVNHFGDEIEIPEEMNYGL